jgi:demethylmenaquinone methyltransferase/2-methoxy-6-polyprenyl-1,4-benzoquinol methylase
VAVKKTADNNRAMKVCPAISRGPSWPCCWEGGIFLGQFIASGRFLEDHFDVERQRVFDHMAPQWDVMIPPVPAEKIRELVDAADVEGKTVLDVGAGTGALVAEGLAAGPGQWIACDLSMEMLRTLQAKFKNDGGGAAPQPGRGLLLLHADVHCLPLEEASVDRVICHNVFPHFQQPKIALAQLFRVMRPGALLIVNHFSGRAFINQVHRSSPQAVLHKDLLAPAEEAAEWLREAGFEVTGLVDSEELYRITAVRPGDG